MRASDAYKGLLRELDKFESPTFTISDFNYFYAVAISKYLTDNYGDFDVLQKDLDDIKALLIYKHSLTFSDIKAKLPDNYRHSLGLEVLVEVIEETTDYKVGDEVTLYPKRLATNRKGYTADNAYQMPSVNYASYQLDDTNVHVFTGEYTEIKSGYLDYIKTPDAVYLNPDRSLDYEEEVNNTTLQFPDYVNLEIIKVCRLIFLENIESVRYQSSLQDAQLDKQKE